MEDLVFCFDVGGTSCKVGIFSQSGELIKWWKTSSRLFSDPQTFVAGFREEIFRFEDFKNYSTISIGVPGLVKDDGVVVESPNLPLWKNLDVQKIISEAFGVKVFVENDANLFALGEGYAGSAKDFKSYLGITLGTGIGGGIVIDGRLIKGQKGMAGEIGHMVIHPNGPLCGCGNKGCLEAYSSGRAIKNQMHQLTGLELEPEDIFNLAKKGDKKALKVFEKAGYHLGIGIANLVNILDINCVILGGGISSAFELMINEIKKGFREHTFKIHFDTTVINKTSLQDLSALYGAFSLTIQNVKH